MKKLLSSRRRWLVGIIASISAWFTTRSVANQAFDASQLHFPGDPVEHFVVYHFNKNDNSYQEHILFSIAALMQHYDNNIQIVVSCMGPGIHLLAKKRPRSDMTPLRLKSLSEKGVIFHACGNTMDSLGWTNKDILDFVQIVPVGVADLIDLQEKKYAYIAW